ncbi:hypothetical protein CK203_005061 [Vitis vinifera]|uniref:Uncharacterized protein n=1 Tax=Vitis vinifera TaxID=29760 RepID=A0A438KEY1_VITVI|nr:hypothetical protein CK203_005061 [Vitis vinifera]
MVIATLRAAVRNRGDGTWAMADCCDSVFRFNPRPKNVFKEESCFICRVGDAHEKSTDNLSVKEFEDRFCIPNSEQFNAGLRFPLPALFKEFLHFTQIPPAFIHPNIVRHVRSPALPSIGDGAATRRRRGEGIRIGPGCMGGVIRASGEALRSNYSLEIPDRRQGEALQDAASARNLMAVVRESGICCQYSPGKCKGGGAWGALYCEGSPIYQEFKEADAEKRRALLDNREKKKNEGTLRKAPGQKRDADSPPKKNPAKKRKLVKNGKGVKEPTPPKNLPSSANYSRGGGMIEEPVNPAPHSISSGSGHVAGLNHSSTSLAAVVRLANLAEEAASINHPDSPNRMPMQLRPFGLPSKRPRSARNLRSDSSGGFKIVSKRSKLVAHPPKTLLRRGEVEVATEIPAVPVMVPDEVAPGETHPAVNVEALHLERKSPSAASSGGELVNDAACSSASSFSYAELEDKLKQIPPAHLTSCPQPRCSRWWKRGLRGMAQQHDLFSDLLRTTDYMKIFASRHKESENQLRLRLEEVEASLSISREDNEALRADLAEAKSWEESSFTRLCESEDEVARLRAERKKEELEREFAAEREELEADYQKQVDDTFIFGYRCCMKKNGIKRDVPSIPPGEEKKLHDKPP